MLAKLNQHSSHFFYLIAAAICVVQSVILEVPGDSSVFFNAGLDIRNGINPWLESEDSVNFQFLNGPINSLFWGMSSVLGIKGNFIFTTVLSVILVPSLISNAFRLFQREMGDSDRYIFSALFISTFVFRSNVQYGQIVVVYASIFLFLLNRLRDDTSSIQTHVLTSFGLFCCMDYKPQVFIVFLLLVRRTSIKYLIIGFSLGFLAQAFTTYFITDNPLPIDWIKRIISRGSGESSHSGYYGFVAFLHELGVPALFSWLLLFSMSLIFFIILHFRKIHFRISLILIFFIFSPFSHPQDSVLLFAFFLVVSQRGWLTWITFGFALAWSTNIFVALFFLIVSCLSVHQIQRRSKLKSDYVSVITISIPQITFLLISILSSSSDLFRVLFNSLGIVFAALLLARKDSVRILSLNLR